MKKFIKRILGVTINSGFKNIYRGLEGINIGLEGQFKEIIKLNKKVEVLGDAMVDPHNGMISLKMELSNIPIKYMPVFYKMKKGDICFDCGAHIGRISDIFLQMGGVVHAFEPNKHCVDIIGYKFENNPNITIINAAVSDSDGEAEFYSTESPQNLNDYQGNSLYPVENLMQDCIITVKTIDFCEYIQENIVSHGKRIYILKMDIEGAEFKVLPKLIEAGMYKHIDYIFVEKHERFFNDGDKKLQHIESLIEKNNITNIYLDWI